MAVELWWWPMTPWLTPGVAWFIFFNVVVGAIAVMSRREQGGHGPTGTGRRKLARTASTVVLERLRSISIFSFHHTAADYGVASSPASPIYHLQDQHCDTFRGKEAEEDRLVRRVAPELGKPVAAPVARESGAAATTEPPSAPVAAAVAAAASESEEEEAEAEAEAEAEPVPVAREGGAAATTTSTPSAPVAASASEGEEEEEESEDDDDEESISLEEAYALARAQRRSSRDSGAGTEADATAKRRAHACGRRADEVEGKAEVNARAELFIRQFREELKLQRINSIINYTTELRRRAGTADARALHCVEKF